jgi:hypothetical protein
MTPDQRLVAALREAIEVFERLECVVGRSRDAQCVECARMWTDDVERWRTYMTEDGELALYCPDCAEAEFGE